MVWDWSWGKRNGAQDPEESLKAILPKIPLFEGLTARDLRRFVPEFQWFCLPGGWTLLRPETEGTAIYIVTVGSLGLWLPDGRGGDKLAGQFVSGQTVGELAVLSGEPRTSSITALRDTELIAISRDVFEKITAQHPQVMANLSHHLVQRLRDMILQQRDPEARPSPPRTIALVPLCGTAPCHEMATRIAHAFRRRNLKPRMIDSAWDRPDTESFYQLEQENDLVIYLSDDTPTPWSRQCLRQADKILLVVNAGADLSQAAPMAEMLTPARHNTTELVFLHPPETAYPKNTAAWLERFKPEYHHHLPSGDQASLDRLIRHIAGRAVGLVLAGGGARGYAHIGVIRALREAHIPIDMIGGTSSGGIIGACVAMGWPNDEIQARIRHAFVEADPFPLTDMALPHPWFTGFYRGRKIIRLLKENFRDQRIEDLWLPFYCVSVNLTRSRQMVHRSGTLWQALRASASIPGLLVPVTMNGEILVDGGVLNNFPVTLMREQGRGPVIGIDIEDHEGFASHGPTSHQGAPSFGLLGLDTEGGPAMTDILVRSGTISSELQTNLSYKRTDLLFTPVIQGAAYRDWESFERLVEAGYAHAVEVLENADLSLFDRTNDWTQG